MSVESSVAISRDMLSADALRLAETHAAILPMPGRKEKTDARDLVRRLEGRGINTCAIPLIAGGDILFPVARGLTPVIDGSIADEFAATVHAEHLSLWLYVDPVSAARPGAERPSNFARRHTSWLMRGARREFGPFESPGRAASFCWHNPAWRRFATDAVTLAMESLPVEALLLDLRGIPLPTRDVSKWSIFGVAALASLKRELGIDPDEVLSDPDDELFADVERWRLAEFEDFLEQIASRMRAVRPDAPIIALADNRVGPDGELFLPHVRWTQSGLISEVAILGEPSQARLHARELDADASRPVPVIAACRDEGALTSQLAGWMELPVHGWLCLEAGAGEDRVPEIGDLAWSRPGSIESDPVEAAARFAFSLLEAGSDVEPLAAPLRELLARIEELHTVGDPDRGVAEQLPLAAVERMRESLEAAASRIRDGSLPAAESLRSRLVVVERLTRILSLVPSIPVIVA